MDATRHSGLVKFQTRLYRGGMRRYNGRRRKVQKMESQGTQKKESHLAYELPPLPYAFDALEPHIDAKTMEIHHDKHHGAYVTNLNKALEGQPELAKLSLDELMRKIDTVPEAIRTAVRNNGGGHWNHSMFWKIMKKDTHGAGEPKGAIGEAIKAAFGSFAEFKTKFAAAGMARFGSGWAWLVNKDGELAIESTPNQDNPLMSGGKAVMGVDVWEHAYYLKYQNRRADYLAAWWEVADWDAIDQNFIESKR